MKKELAGILLEAKGMITEWQRNSSACKRVAIQLSGEIIPALRKIRKRPAFLCRESGTTTYCDRWLGSA
ncbi:MAG: hypothetical protein IPJ20_15195 [Flammeovirgaceae bacterium]|nr:hypothetical protein [Flammeovirgaceae bacterium]